MATIQKWSDIEREAQRKEQALIEEEREKFKAELRNENGSYNLDKIVDMLFILSHSNKKIINYMPIKIK